MRLESCCGGRIPGSVGWIEAVFLTELIGTSDTNVSKQKSKHSWIVRTSWSDVMRLYGDPRLVIPSSVRVGGCFEVVSYFMDFWMCRYWLSYSNIYRTCIWYWTGVFGFSWYLVDDEESQRHLHSTGIHRSKMTYFQRLIRWLYMRYVFVPLTHKILIEIEFEDEYDAMNPINIARAMHERRFNELHWCRSSRWLHNRAAGS